MNVSKYLAIAGVPSELHADAVACIELARERAKGLLWHKIKVRFFRAGKIAKAMEWHHNRLLYVKPEWAEWDIAPMINIRGHGDNGDWIVVPVSPKTPQGSYPTEDDWTNPDPTSAEYVYAVSKNYWAKGLHPRSPESRKAWYRRNGGEYLAWKRGLPVQLPATVQVWKGEQNGLQVKVTRSGSSWIIVTRKALLGKLSLHGRLGFEIDNVLQTNGCPSWFPLDGYELRAPVTWSIRPRFK